MIPTIKLTANIATTVIRNRCQKGMFTSRCLPISAILNNMGSSRQAPPVRELLRHTWSGFKKGPPTTKNSEMQEQEVKESADYAISDGTVC